MLIFSKNSFKEEEEEGNFSVTQCLYLHTVKIGLCINYILWIFILSLRDADIAMIVVPINFFNVADSKRDS